MNVGDEVYYYRRNSGVAEPVYTKVSKANRQKITTEDGREWAAGSKRQYGAGNGRFSWSSPVLSLLTPDMRARHEKAKREQEERTLRKTIANDLHRRMLAALPNVEDEGFHEVASKISDFLDTL